MSDHSQQAENKTITGPSPAPPTPFAIAPGDWELLSTFAGCAKLCEEGAKRFRGLGPGP